MFQTNWSNSWAHLGHSPDEDPTRPMRYKLSVTGAEGYEDKARVPKLDPDEIITDPLGNKFRRSQVTPKHLLALNLVIWVVTEEEINNRPRIMRGLPVMGPYLPGELYDADDRPHYHAYLDTLLCDRKSNWGSRFQSMGTAEYEDSTFDPTIYKKGDFGTFVPPGVLFPLPPGSSVQRAQVGFFTMAGRRKLSVRCGRWDAGHLLIERNKEWSSLEIETKTRRKIEAGQRVKDYLEQMAELREMIRKEKELIKSLR